ncbi:MAG: LacI family transcriptional regulator [Armatimonadetes bacterium]|nr:LacI family transcriptional regulator [Armatimonadota bacterium]
MNPPPLKPVTIQGIADALGVHKSTVSIALSGKGRISSSMRARVLSFAGELGYEPDPLAQRLASRSKSRLVCLCSGSLDPGRGAEKIALIQSALSSLGLEVPFYTPPKYSEGSSQGQAALFRQLRRARPQAIVCSVHTFHDEAFAELEQYQNEGGIVVSYDLPIPLACDQVVFDRVDNAYQGARYLLERGHRHIGLGMSRLVGSRTSNLNSTQNLRVAGFRRALSESGAEIHSEWIFENETYERGGAQMAQHFLELKERPTGLCIVNDYVALAFMVELMRAGVRIPQDVSIVGHDDQPIAAYCPVPLTSVSQPVEDIVQAAVQLLTERIEGGNGPARTVTICGSLIERQSVAAPLLPAS